MSSIAFNSHKQWWADVPTAKTNFEQFIKKGKHYRVRNNLTSIWISYLYHSKRMIVFVSQWRTYHQRTWTQDAWFPKSTHYPTQPLAGKKNWSNFLILYTTLKQIRVITLQIKYSRNSLMSSLPLYVNMYITAFIRSFIEFIFTQPDIL